MSGQYRNFGYRCLGPLLLGYSNWLLENFNKEDIGKVYFFSRDGYIMKQAWDLLYPDENIDTYYLEVSRRSLRVPILWKNHTIENILTMVSPSMLIDINSIFDAVGLEIKEYAMLLSKYGYDEKTYFYRKEILDNKQFQLFYKELSLDIEKISLQEYKYMQAYINQNNIGGKFAIVDIGWSGGMQRFLQTILEDMAIECDIYGYYTGIAEYYKRNLSDRSNLCMSGYLFDFSHNPNDFDCRSCFVGLYEMLFLETKGSVKRYMENATGYVYAERYPYEYIVDGELLDEVKAITEVQKGALEYVRENQHTNISDKYSLCRSLLQAGQKPTSEAVRLFANFRFFDEGECCYLAKPQKWSYYLMHIKDLKNDFLRSRWKTAFLRKLLKLPLSYISIYYFLKRHLG